MLVVRSGASFVVYAPAKLNLHLEVLARRSDGYHDLETLMTAIGLFDTLTFTPVSDENLSLTCRWARGHSARSGESPSGDLPLGKDNIVVKAVKRLRERTGVSSGAQIELVKRIPSAAGLGGASSDAAAALVAANEAWGLCWPLDRLADVAAEIGSDVPFFLHAGQLGPGSAVCRGKGERIEAVGLTRLNYVVVRPPEGLSTPLVFRHCRPSESPASVVPILTAAREGIVPKIAIRLANRLTEPAAGLSASIARVRGELRRAGCSGEQMTGSGSSCYGLFRHRRAARRAAAWLRARRLGAVHYAPTAPSPRRRGSAAKT